MNSNCWKRVVNSFCFCYSFVILLFLCPKPKLWTFQLRLFAFLHQKIYDIFPFFEHLVKFFHQIINQLKKSHSPSLWCTKGLLQEVSCLQWPPAHHSLSRLFHCLTNFQFVCMTSSLQIWHLCTANLHLVNFVNIKEG